MPFPLLWVSYLGVFNPMPFLLQPPLQKCKAIKLLGCFAGNEPARILLMEEQGWNAPLCLFACFKPCLRVFPWGLLLCWLVLTLGLAARMSGELVLNALSSLCLLRLVFPSQYSCFVLSKVRIVFPKSDLPSQTEFFEHIAGPGSSQPWGMSAAAPFHLSNSQEVWGVSLACCWKA